MTTGIANLSPSAPSAPSSKPPPRAATFNPNAPIWHKDLTFDVVGPADFARVIGVTGRGMRDNPAQIAALAPDPEVRRRSIERLCAGALGGGIGFKLIAARRTDDLFVGVCGRIAPSECQPNIG